MSPLTRGNVNYVAVVALSPLDRQRAHHAPEHPERGAGERRGHGGDVLGELGPRRAAGRQGEQLRHGGDGQVAELRRQQQQERGEVADLEQRASVSNSAINN